MHEGPFGTISLSIVSFERYTLQCSKYTSMCLNILWLIGSLIFSLNMQDLKKKPKYLVIFTVGIDQMNNIDACLKKVRQWDHSVFAF